MLARPRATAVDRETFGGLQDARLTKHQSGHQKQKFMAFSGFVPGSLGLCVHLQ